MNNYNLKYPENILISRLYDQFSRKLRKMSLVAPPTIFYLYTVNIFSVCKIPWMVSPWIGVYRTEDVRGPGEGDTLYLPLDFDTYVNLTRVDEVTFRQGIFFIGDSSGRYIESVQGSALFQW